MHVDPVFVHVDVPPLLFIVPIPDAAVIESFQAPDQRLELKVDAWL
jgi:hypothetical protein